VAGPGNFEIEVVDADPRRVKRLRIYRKKAPPAGSDRDGKRRRGRADTAQPAPAESVAPTEPAAAATTGAAQPSSPGAGH